MDYNVLCERLDALAAIAKSLYYINDLAKNDAGDEMAATSRNVLKHQLHTHYEMLVDEISN